MRWLIVFARVVPHRREPWARSTLICPWSRAYGAIGTGDSDPISPPVGTITVDKPITTNGHTSPKDAVPSQ
ncbi:MULTISPECIES: hypothetical protein [unclassified Streptomyces]|uniref:hypothetical protein n=1 Tax=unclassified Streptomyces TaxID=2593676 RepID=UPI002E2A0AED|nr:hypothetical protein [Streptomyces sp. NBC_00273]